MRNCPPALECTRLHPEVPVVVVCKDHNDVCRNLGGRYEGDGDGLADTGNHNHPIEVRDRRSEARPRVPKLPPAIAPTRISLLREDLITNALLDHSKGPDESARLGLRKSSEVDHPTRGLLDRTVVEVLPIEVG